MVPFKTLKTNQQFKYQDMIWVKVIPVKKSCCKVLYNAHVVGNKDIRKVFSPNQEVEPV